MDGECSWDAQPHRILHRLTAPKKTVSEGGFGWD